MIFGLGVNLVEPEKVKNFFSTLPEFKTVNFTENEVDYCEPKLRKFQNYSARYAAKKAFLNALGEHNQYNLSLKEIEILNDERGKPAIVLTGMAKKLSQDQGFKNIQLSMSHTKEYANAIVTIEH
jgi:holo-[acyl-carrier protein] synthase